MNSELKKYVLCVYAKHDKQDEFVRLIANEIALITMSPDVRFYYGNDSMIFTFQSSEPTEDIFEFVGIVLGATKITYMLFPYTDDNLSVNLTDEVKKYLFGGENLVKNDDNTISVQNLLNEDNINQELLFEFYSESSDELDDDDEVLQKIYRENNKKKKKPSVDEILDKIRLSSINSITKEEKEILDNYSKQL
jgi:hypothetical protein